MTCLPIRSSELIVHFALLEHTAFALPFQLSLSQPMFFLLCLSYYLPSPLLGDQPSDCVGPSWLQELICNTHKSTISVQRPCRDKSLSPKLQGIDCRYRPHWRKYQGQWQGMQGACLLATARELILQLHIFSFKKIYISLGKKRKKKEDQLEWKYLCLLRLKSVSARNTVAKDCDWRVCS